jgi:hypothetical protein
MRRFLSKSKRCTADARHSTDAEPTALLGVLARRIVPITSTERVRAERDASHCPFTNPRWNATAKCVVACIQRPIRLSHATTLARSLAAHRYNHPSIRIAVHFSFHRSDWT